MDIKEIKLEEYSREELELLSKEELVELFFTTTRFSLRLHVNLINKLIWNGINELY